MSRFSNDFRDQIANRVCRHFDKYCEFTNPLTFDAIEDVYRQAFEPRKWNAMNELLDCKFGRKCLNRSGSFELYTGDDKQKQKYSRTHITFGFPDGKTRPNLDIEFQQLHADVQDKILHWIQKAVALRELRQKLYWRINNLFDCEWEKNRSYGANGWFGGPEPGVGCNTPGQVHRIWPELLAFMPVEMRDTVRNASTKSRLPDRIHNWGSVEQFLCLEARHDGQDEKELAFERRVFDALTHILVQMSMMVEVRHVEGYPTVSLA